MQRRILGRWQPMTQRLTFFLSSLFLAVVAIVISYEWIDRPVAFFMAAHAAHKSAFDLMQRLPEAFPVLTAVIFVVAGLWTVVGRPLPCFLKTLLLSSIAYVAAEAVNRPLKIAFGRTWPDTWTHNNPSLVHDHVYGFQPFHGGPGFLSFPSGHTVAICSVVAVFWQCYPRYRPLYALAVAVVIAGLIGADYHFVSDMIAGGFVGASTGWIAVLMWRSAETKT
jgi:membrane-associated phospholipid phosphatase